MKEQQNNNDETRKKIIGLGEGSARKNYFPLLQQKYDELRQKNIELEASHQKIIETNKELIKINSQKDAILKCLPDLMFAFSADGYIIDYYAGTYDELYTDPDVFINRKVSDVLPAEIANLTVEKTKKVLESGGTEEYTYELTIHNEIKTFEARMVYVNEDTTLSIVRDITENVRLIEALEKAIDKARESDKLKSAFLANMSHEIRTPMNGIIGYSELLKNKDYSEEERNRFANTVISSSRQLLNIVNDILAISRIESGTMKTHCRETVLGEILDDSVNIYSSVAIGKNLEFNVDCEDPELVVNVDKQKIVQVLTNLFSNAFKFTSQGSVTLRAEKESSNLVFDVTDTGIGIPSDKRDVIFERFMQVEVEVSRQYGGTGLGLSISRNLAKLMGGTLTLMPDTGTGSHFRLIVPVK